MHSAPAKSAAEGDEEVVALAQAVLQAARIGDVAQLREGLDLGLPPNLRNEKGDSLLMLASYHGHPGAAKLLLERGADPNAINDRGQTPLAGAAFKGDLAMVELLVDGGAAIDGTGPDGKTPLMFAAMFDRPAIVAFLVARGAAPDRRDAGGAASALSLARAMGAGATTRYLEELAAASPER